MRDPVRTDSIQLSDESVLRALRSLIAHELSQSRRVDGFQLGSESWCGDTSISARPGGDEGPSMDADSLELINLATAVTHFFQLHRIGLEDYLLRYRTLGQWVEVVQASRDRGETAIGFQTSGSTGTPRQVVHRWCDLEQEVGFFSELIPSLGGFQPQRLLVPVPCHHIYGFLFGVVLADHLRMPVISGPPAWAEMMRSGFRRGDLVIGHPFFWNQVAKRPVELPPQVLGVTSTSPCEPDTAEALKQMGLEGLLQIYGSTETAGIGWRVKPEAHFELLPRWRRTSGSPELADRASGAVHSLPDNVHWHDETHLLPLARRDRAVQVGGVNVYPDRIAWHLEQVDFVVAAHVDLVGERLQARIQATHDAPTRDQMRASLRQWCARQLSSPERPSIFEFV